MFDEDQFASESDLRSALMLSFSTRRSIASKIWGTDSCSGVIPILTTTTNEGMHDAGAFRIEHSLGIRSACNASRCLMQELR